MNLEDLNLTTWFYLGEIKIKMFIVNHIVYIKIHFCLYVLKSVYVQQNINEGDYTYLFKKLIKKMTVNIF